MICRFMPFSRVSARSEMPTTLFRIWTRVAVFISYDHHHYITHLPHIMLACNCKDNSILSYKWNIVKPSPICMRMVILWALLSRWTYLSIHLYSRYYGYNYEILKEFSTHYSVWSVLQRKTSGITGQLVLCNFFFITNISAIASEEIYITTKKKK